MRFPDRIFITGTDTGIGKTVVSAILMAGLEGLYWKPVQSGLEGMTDTEWVREKTGLDDTHFLPETYRLRLPLSPHASAAAEGKRIEMERFLLPDVRERKTLIIEGAGGILVPLNDKDMMIDLIKRLKAPAVIVTRSGLGTINHTLLTLRELRAEGIEILGVVMNGHRNSGNMDAIERFGKVRVIAQVEYMEEIKPSALKHCFMKYFEET